MVGLSVTQDLITEYGNGENCLKWVYHVGLTEQPKHQDTTSTLLTPDLLRLKDFDEKEDHAHDDHVEGRAAVNILANRLALNFNCNVSQHYTEARTHLREGQESLKKYIDGWKLPFEYKAGIEYAFKGAELLQTFFKAKRNDATLTETNVAEALEELRKLNASTSAGTAEEEKKLVGLYAIKYHFMSKLTRGSGREHVQDLLLKLKTIEPDNFEWPLYEYAYYERVRRNVGKRAPDTREKAALEEAVRLIKKAIKHNKRENRMDTQVTASCMTFVAALLKSHNPKKDFKESFAKTNFNSRQEAANYVNEKAEEIYKEEKKLFQSSLLEVIRVYCSGLPKEFCDPKFELAKKCLEKAEIIRGENPKVKFQRGHLRAKQGLRKEAVRNFLECYAEDSSQVSALINALAYMMSSLDEYTKDECKELFSQVKINDVQSENAHQKERLEVCEGMYYLLKLKDEERGMKHLIAALEESDPEGEVLEKYYKPLCIKFGLSDAQKQQIQALVSKYWQNNPGIPVDPNVSRFMSYMRVDRNFDPMESSSRVSNV